MNPSRRLFLKSFAALAAAAVLPKTLALLPQDDYQRLLAMMRTGRVVDQIFLFHQPITINFDNLFISRCKFLFRCPTHERSLVIINANNLYMEGCVIDGGRLGAEYGMEVLPQAGDMTSTFQSALDTLSNGSKAERTLAVAAGYYEINKTHL